MAVAHSYGECLGQSSRGAARRRCGPECCIRKSVDQRRSERFAGSVDGVVRAGGEGVGHFPGMKQQFAAPRAYFEIKLPNEHPPRSGFVQHFGQVVRFAHWDRAKERGPLPLSLARKTLNGAI